MAGNSSRNNLQRYSELKSAIAKLKSTDSSTLKLIESVGVCKLQPIGKPYYVLIKSIISQQLSTQAASSILKKLNHSFKTTDSVPDPKILINASPRKLRNCGLSFAKVETVKRIAEAYESKDLSDKLLHSLSDEDVMRHLCSFKGIGPWTSEMTLIFALDRWDCFSVGDLGLCKAIEKWYGIPKNAKKEILKFTEKFSPYRSIISWYLWASSDTEIWE